MTWELTIENTRGIREGQVSIDQGVNVVRASNWHGKSSLIASVKTALGIERPLTEGEDRGQVTLDAGEETVTVELRRTDDGEVVRTGDPYLTDDFDRLVVDLFAALDETNEVRQAVRNRENLEDVLTRPLDFEDIERRLAELREQRERVDAELERAEAAADDIPAAQERVTRLETTLEELRDRREEIGGDGTTEDVLTAEREELSDLRAERERLQGRVDRLKRTVERTREELNAKRDELDGLTVPDAPESESELADVREEFESVQRDAKLLQDVYTANRRVVDEGRFELLADVEHGLLGDAIDCWVCGDETDRETVQANLDRMADRVADLQDRSDEYRERIEELEQRRDAVEQKRRRKADLEEAVADLEATLADREESLATARERLEEVEDRITELEESVEEIDETVTNLESEIKYKELELEEAREELAELEQQAERREALRDQRERLTEDLTRLRNRKTEIKRDMRDSFQRTMTDLLERFDTGFETARLTDTFEFVVARDGREASLDALSQGERELLGIVTALSGHEAYDVGERAPILLLDDLGGLADRNLQTLVEYLETRVDYLLFTSYPEDSAFEGHEIEFTDWEVVSDPDNSGAGLPS